MRNKILYGILFLLIISAAIGLLYINKRDTIAIIQNKQDIAKIPALFIIKTLKSES